MTCRKLKAGDALEKPEHLLADQRHSRDDHDGDTAGDEGVFNGRGPMPVPGKAGQSKSRSMGMSGRSAGGIEYVLNSRGLTHFSAECSSALGVPSQRRHT
jgi:hypothetical protein